MSLMSVPIKIAGVNGWHNAGLRFPEYDIYYHTYKLNDDSGAAEKNAALFISVVSAHDFVVECMEGLRKLGFPDDPEGFGFSFDPMSGEVTYGLTLFSDYFHKQLSAASEWVLDETKVSNFAIMKISLRKAKTTRGFHFGLGSSEIYKAAGLQGNRGGVSTVADVLKVMTIMRDAFSAELMAGGVEPSMNNILKFWALNYGVLTKLSCFKLNPDADEKKIIRTRVIELLKHNIPVFTALTAVSWYGNPNYGFDGVFSFSAETLSEFNDLPASFVEHFMRPTLLDS